MKRLLALSLLAGLVAGCGSTASQKGSAGKTSKEQTKTLFNMAVLAENLKSDTGKNKNVLGKWGTEAYSVTCTKIATLEAKCVMRFHESGSSAEGEINETVEIAPDGQTYGSRAETAEVQKVQNAGESAPSPPAGAEESG